MSDHLDLEARLKKLIAMAASHLPETDLKDIADYVYYTEYGLAFELLCSVLVKAGKPIDLETYKLADELGKQMELDPGTCEPLRSLVRE